MKLTTVRSSDSDLNLSDTVQHSDRIREEHDRGINAGSSMFVQDSRRLGFSKPFGVIQLNLERL